MLRIAALASLAIGLATLPGCFAPKCGVFSAASAHSDGGTITFDSTPVGVVEDVEVPFADSVDTDETVNSVTITGPDAAAFSVVTTFPLAAEITLNTAGMGPSPEVLTGTGVASDRQP